jgi:hypothetical protein
MFGKSSNTNDLRNIQTLAAWRQKKLCPARMRNCVFPWSFCPGLLYELSLRDMQKPVANDAKHISEIK